MLLHSSGSKKGLGIRILYVFLVLTLSYCLFLALNNGNFLQLSLIKMQQMKEQLPQMLDYIHSFSINSSLLLFGLAILQGFLPVIPFFLLAGASGVINGIWLGLLLIWTGATIGALVLFTIARYFGKEHVQSWLQKKDWELNYTEEQGFGAILFARLIPVFPSVAINLACGVSKVRFSSFGTATALGKLPWTFLYTSLGYNLSQGHLWAVYLSLALLGIFISIIFCRWLYPVLKR